MPLIPSQLNIRALPWDLVAQGKVRDIYAVPGHPELQAHYVSDRISVFDCVLGFAILRKGAVLNSLNVYVKHMLELADVIRTDLVASGLDVDQYLPESHRTNPHLQSRLTIVRKLEPIKVECVVRGYLWGSAVKAYDGETGLLHGQFVGKNLKPGDRFEHPILDPTTKAPDGEHDEPISVEEVKTQYPELAEKSIEIFTYLRMWAEEKGFILVDTKFEFALVDDEWVLVDEVATLDSSRYWSMEDYASARAAKSDKIPELSKEFARQVAIQCGIKELTDQSNFEAAQQVMFSPSETASVSTIYRYMFWKLTGEKLEQFWQNRGVNLVRDSQILVISGSTSDDPQLIDGIKHLFDTVSPDGFIHAVCSCHRSPAQLLYLLGGMLAQGELGNVDTIIAAAGKAAHLPGMTKAFLTMFGLGHIPVLGVALSSQEVDETEQELDNEAAMGSITRLPNPNPLELDGDGVAYLGSQGFRWACENAVTDEFLPKPMKEKDALLRSGGEEQTIGKEEAVRGLVGVFIAMP